MTYEQAKIFVKEQLSDYLMRKGIEPRRPFHCLNPAHPDKTPSMSFDPRRNKCKCFSCNASYDTFDLVAIDYRTTGGETFKKAFDLYGLTIEPEFTPKNTPELKHKTRNALHSYQNALYAPSSHSPDTSATPSENAHSGAVRSSQGYAANLPDLRPAPDAAALTQAVGQAHAALMGDPAALSYLHRRGLTDETIRRHRLGYSADGQNALLTGSNERFQSRSRKAGLYRYIFPVLGANGECRYFISEICDRSQLDDHSGKYMKLRDTPQRFFNENIIPYNSGVIFVCEGVYDALSIEQSGGRAIALTGTGGNAHILELESKPGTDNTYIIALDSDTAGRRAAQNLKQALTKAGKACIIEPLNGAKDANELLQKDPAALADYVRKAVNAAERHKAEFDRLRGIAKRLLDERESGTGAGTDTGTDPTAGELAEMVTEREREYADYPKLSAAAQLQDFIQNIKDSEFQRAFSTGFGSLDRALDGGIYPGGLYFIGAISSLGKTTLALQIADNIAAAGRDVLIFSLEMARDELMAKSISRHTFFEDKRLYGVTAHAKSTRGILKGSSYRYHTEEDKRVIRAALESYAKYAEHIYISVGVGTIGVDEIRGTAEKHIRVTGNVPVIIIDYLQILAPADPRATDKQNTDTAVLELKRLARDKHTPVIAISSFNRQSYTDPVSMSSFKESGAVEYTSDVLIGLQYMGMDFIDGEGDKERWKRVRELQKSEEEKGRNGQPQKIQVKIIKQRNFAKGDIVLSFYPRYNCYLEDTAGGTVRTERVARVENTEKTGKTIKTGRQKELERLTAAFREAESPKGSNRAALEEMANKLDMKKATVKARLKEFTDIFTIEGDIIIYSEKEA